MPDKIRKNMDVVRARLGKRASVLSFDNGYWGHAGTYRSTPNGSFGP